MSDESPPRLLALLREFGLGDDDLLAWEETQLPLDGFEDWLTDRVARRPGGRRAREVYGAEDVHDFARRAILDALALQPGDRLLDVGCGGGLLLRDALASGATVTGLDHSEEMVRLARERAPQADVVLGRAEHLPFADESFTAIAMSIVFFFLPDPIKVLRECRRVLAPSGRLAVYTTSPALRGTPAAPEPLASRGHFYADEELADLARPRGPRGRRGGQRRRRAAAHSKRIVRCAQLRPWAGPPHGLLRFVRWCSARVTRARVAGEMRVLRRRTNANASCIGGSSGVLSSRSR